MKSDFLIELQSKVTISERKDQIQAQIDEIDESINLINQLKTLEKSGTTLNKTYEINGVISPCNGFALSKAAIVAWFNYNNFKLSAELLNYSFVNRSYLSTYYPNPNNTAKIKNTSWFQTTKSQTQAGESTFQTGDLYYSIKKFKYWFAYDFGLIKYMVISDDYDFDSGDQSYPTAAGVATTEMLSAQLLGCLVPFTTTINLPTQ